MKELGGEDEKSQNEESTLVYQRSFPVDFLLSERTKSSHKTKKTLVFVLFSGTFQVVTRDLLTQTSATPAVPSTDP
ncbi:hypothetical protein CHARACLAT_016177 [Characodon lateralis]|uniref:Uncharacterized protein n=1 Tax=Characodon lateralis TaxID=208331 RepID=A0ABU7DH34_9TELE|nr:hypothetical protein [Characodon lateralis]